MIEILLARLLPYLPRLAALGARALLVVAIVALIFHAGAQHQQAKDQKAEQVRLLAHVAKDMAKAEKNLSVIRQAEVRYVDRFQIMRVPVVKVRDRLVAGLCSNGVQQSADAAAAGSMPRSQGADGQPADAADGADSDPGLSDDVAGEIAAAVRNRIKGEGLQAAIRGVAAP